MHHILISIDIALSVIAVAGVFGLLFQRGRTHAPNVHVHAWKAYEVQYPIGGLGVLFGAVGAIDQLTRTLYRCGCNKTRIDDIPGRWTLGQVTGNPDDDVMDATIVDVEYPYTEGNTIVLGPECFIDNASGNLAYKGEWYAPMPATKQTGTANEHGS